MGTLRVASFMDWHFQLFHAGDAAFALGWNQLVDVVAKQAQKDNGVFRLVYGVLAGELPD